MIIIFEPQCRGFAHEQFNAGFLYGYSLAYPQERIVFFGEEEHIKCIKAIFGSANLSLNNIEFNEAEIPQPDMLRAVFEYARMLKNLLTYACANECKKVVLLSIHTYNLLPLKYLRQFKSNNSIEIHIAMHGILETIKRKNQSLLSGFSQKVIWCLKKVFGNAHSRLAYEPTNQYLYERLFKFALHIGSNKNITYFVFREDSLVKIREYAPAIGKHFRSIDIPYIYKDFKNSFNARSSTPIVFGTLQKGFDGELNKIVRVLTKNRNLANKFDVRIIGDNANKNLEVLGPIKHISNNGKLTREDIEELVKDVRYMLLFYAQDSYELITSGVFFDAVAYSKPVIFLKNHCLDFYYNKYKFGYRCNGIDEMINVMKEVVSGVDINYQSLVSEILRMQQDVSISNNYFKLKFDED